TPPRNEHKAAGAFAPIGLGAHRCLGGNMGELLAMTVVARLLRQFEFSLVPSDYDMRVVNRPLRRPEPSFRIRVVGRRGVAERERRSRRPMFSDSVAQDSQRVCPKTH